jgi:selenocysteine lyase/cysteine desulfurase
MLGPKETGLLYVRKDMLDVVQAKFIGAYSDNGFDLVKGTLTLHPTAQRYEHGTVSVPIRVGLGAAIRFLERIGMEIIWRRDRDLSTRLFDGLKAISYVQVLSPVHPDERSALITFKHEKLSFGAVQEHLNSRNLRTRGVGEGGVNGIRISTHIYNTYDEVERVLEAVRTVWKR